MHTYQLVQGFSNFPKARAALTLVSRLPRAAMLQIGKTKTSATHFGYYCKRVNLLVLEIFLQQNQSLRGFLFHCFCSINL